MGRAGAVGVWIVFATSACLEYSPHVLPEGSRRNGNTVAVERILARPAPDPFRFAIVGDTQLFFDETADAIRDIARRDDLALVIQVGDFTDFGTAPEFRLMDDLFGHLRVPYLVVIGNHDYLANGEELFARMFGPRHVAFTVARTRFVLFDSNSRERAFDGTLPDVAWLAEQAAPGAEHDRTVFVSHIPPDDPDFDQRLRPAYTELVRAAGSAISIHGHQHRYRGEMLDGVQLVVADSMDHRSYLVVTVGAGGAFEVERVWF